MRVAYAASTLIALIAVGGVGLAQQQQQTAPRRGGYLAAGAVPQATIAIPPAPEAGSPRDEADRLVYLQTRALAGTPRWALAQSDNVYFTTGLLPAFSCAAGVKMTPQTAPVTSRILTRMLTDQDQASRTAKEVFKRPRPYLVHGGDICIEKSEGLAESPDYPSGHATIGWAAGLILAELLPENAEAVLVRGRAYGESRVVCGVHNPSAVEQGRQTAGIVVAAMHGSAEFRQDMDAARSEIAALKANPANAVDAGQCRAELELTANTPWTG